MRNYFALAIFAVISIASCKVKKNCRENMLYLLFIVLCTYVAVLLPTIVIEKRRRNLTF